MEVDQVVEEQYFVPSKLHRTSGIFQEFILPVAQSLKFCGLCYCGNRIIAAIADSAVSVTSDVIVLVLFCPG